MWCHAQGWWVGVLESNKHGFEEDVTVDLKVGTTVGLNTTEAHYKLSVQGDTK